MSLLLLFLAVFLAGLLAGGFINYCVLRLPYERSLLWPWPRCLKCYQPVGWLDCIPVVGFALLGGRCRSCTQPIPKSYPLVELLTGVLFVVLFALVSGIVELPLGIGKRWNYHPDVALWPALVVFAHHAILLGFLLTASLCDLNDMEIPFSLTLTGTAVGLALATFTAWPFPRCAEGLPPMTALPAPYPGLYPWPVWFPLPSWLPAGSPQLGFATGLAGALAGMLVLRGVRFLFTLGRGLEGMGVGDADLMMMAGAFIGWQMVVIAFFVAVFPGLLFAIVHLFRRGNQTLPFGPSLALGVVLTVLAWPNLGGFFYPLFLGPGSATILAIVGGGGAIGLLGIAFLLRVFRWFIGDQEPQETSHSGS